MRMTIACLLRPTSKQSCGGSCDLGQSSCCDSANVPAESRNLSGDPLIDLRWDKMLADRDQVLSALLHLLLQSIRPMHVTRKGKPDKIGAGGSMANLSKRKSLRPRFAVCHLYSYINPRSRSMLCMGRWVSVLGQGPFAGFSIGHFAVLLRPPVQLSLGMH